jgi:hypothetical protein
VIFVTVGTSVPFDRLVAALAVVDGEELIIQSGHSTNVPPGARSVRFMPYDEVVATMRRARAVVGHAGVGTILTALGAGSVLFVMPRLAAFREAVDDHGDRTESPPSARAPRRPSRRACRTPREADHPCGRRLPAAPAEAKEYHRHRGGRWS